MVCYDCMVFIRKINVYKENVRKCQETLLKTVSSNFGYIQVETLPEFIQPESEEEIDLKPKAEPSKEKKVHKITQKIQEYKRLKQLAILDKKKIKSTKFGSSDEDETDDDSVSNYKNDPNWSDANEVGYVDSLSEADYVRKESDDDEKELNQDGKLPTPTLQFDKDNESVWCPFCFVKFKHKYFLASHGKIKHPEYNW